MGWAAGQLQVHQGRLLLGPIMSLIAIARPSPPPTSNSAGNSDLIYSTYQLVEGMGGNTHPPSILVPALAKTKKAREDPKGGSPCAFDSMV